MKAKNSILDLFVRRGMPKLRGKITGLPLSEPVRVLRDRHGIPHIFAENEPDLMAAQGFVHAQDRLWQMETIRRFAAGRLAEVAGEEMADLDVFARLAGFDTLSEQAVRNTTREDRRLMEAYVMGVNACITHTGKNLPLECRTLKLTPSPWKVADVGGTLPINAWFLQTNYLEELLALSCRHALTIGQWNEIFPCYPGEKLPREDFFTRFKDVKIGGILPEALSYFRSINVPTGGSNNWVVARGGGRPPILANDPHMEMVVPQIWYFCHLQCPTLNVCGASLPGTPGIILGRNEHVAWGATNVMIDCVDLFVTRVDPGNPTRYFIKNKAHEMEREEVAIPIRGGAVRKATIFRTVHGPVITRVEKGVEAVVSLKWYGTFKGDALRDNTLHGFFSIMRARSVKEVLGMCRSIKVVGQHIVTGDVHGNIGWRATGSVPIRKGYSGRLPADGSSGTHRWAGFIPFGRMPNSYNPPGSYIVTANHRLAQDRLPSPISFSWCAHYRRDRIVELVNRTAELGNPTVDDFRRIQMDLRSLQAARILPTILSFTYSNLLAREGSEILKGWDGTMSAGSIEAALFNVFLVQFARLALGELLGDFLPIFLYFMPLMYTAVDHLLRPVRGEKPERPGGKSEDAEHGTGEHPGEKRYAAEVDREARTGEKSVGAGLKKGELLGGRSLDSLCEEALTRSMCVLSEILGADRRKWSWGNLHTYEYCHPGAKGWFASWLLNRGPYPAPGNGSTVNVSVYNPGHRGGIKKQFETNFIPSMRMVADLAGPNETYFIGPMGQSGRPGSRHYADMIGPWMRGELVRIPLTEEAGERSAVKRLVLAP